MPEIQTNEVETERWFGTKFRLYCRPGAEDLRRAFKEGEWEKAVELIKKPKKNAYVPEDVSTVVPASRRKPKNGAPKRIVLD